MIWLGETAVEELLLPYRGVLSCHGAAVRHLKSGPSVALRIEVGGKMCKQRHAILTKANPARSVLWGYIIIRTKYGV